MTLDPMPLELVFLRQRFERLPQILVLDGFLVRRLPAARLPVGQPLEQTLAHVLRIRVDLSAYRAVERFERADHRRELHAVVSRRGLGARDLALVPALHEQGGPAT